MTSTEQYSQLDLHTIAKVNAERIEVAKDPTWTSNEVDKFVSYASAQAHKAATLSEFSVVVDTYSTYQRKCAQHTAPDKRIIEMLESNKGVKVEFIATRNILSRYWCSLCCGIENGSYAYRIDWSSPASFKMQK